jgi:hypothetical protein
MARSVGVEHMAREWKKLKRIPADILSGWASISPATHLQDFTFLYNPNPTWVEADTYLAWSREALARSDAFGWDAAVCYAKRAVCRRIDGFLFNNHLGRYEKKLYPEKMKLLEGIDIVVPAVVRDLIIDRRNDIEHSYLEASPAEAQHAVEIAAMYLRDTLEESKGLALLSIGPGITAGPLIQGNFNPVFSGEEPVFVIDPTGPTPRAMIVHPKDDEVVHAELSDFELGDLTRLAKRLRDLRGRSVGGQLHGTKETYGLILGHLGLR